MVKTFVWPWKDDAELLSVRQLLYPDSDRDSQTRQENQQLGVNIVNTWKLRRCRIPHSIQVTADLVDATLHHNAQKNSLSTIKAVYAAALAKMVTSICDLEQDSVEKRSMAEQAKKIGMSEDWVHLRHSITHGKTPSLRTLELAVRDAIPWMWAHFWKHLDPVDELSEEELRSQLQECLTSFRRQRFLEITSKDPNNSKTILPHQASKILHKLCKKNSHGVDALIQLLVGDKYILPSSKQTNIKFKALLLIWNDLLLKIATKDSAFYEGLAMKLAGVFTGYIKGSSASNAEQNLVGEWLQHILIQTTWTDLLAPLALEDLRCDVVEACLIGLNQHTEKLVQNVFAIMEGDVVEGLRQLASAAMGRTEATPDVMEMKEDASVGLAEDLKDRSGWSRPVDVWIPRPIGMY